MNGERWRTSYMTPETGWSRLARYSGRAKTTGKTFVARFTHFWTVEGGTMVRLQQCADTAQLSKALET